MTIGIISDVHNNTTNLKKVLDYCAQNKIKKVICCGDLASRETLDFLNANFKGEIYYTFGNMDSDQLRDFELIENYQQTKIFKKFGETTIEGQKIAFVHYPDVAKELCQTGKYSFVFYGHTHKPWYSEASAKDTLGQKCIMLNPGNVAGEIYPPTFAVWNTENNKFELIRVHELK